MTYELSASFRTLDAYQKDAMRTRSAKTDLLYSAGKLSVEAGELLQHVLKMRYHAQQVPAARLSEELGDVLWYVAAVATDLGLTLSDVAECNLAKLRVRHGAAYNPAHYQEQP
jgi:NTP pyrophosphatase (non-canonical NTP hydrolase)